MDMKAGFCADIKHRSICPESPGNVCLIRHFLDFFFRIQQIAFIEGDQIGKLFFLKQTNQLFLPGGWPLRCINYKNGTVGAVENLLCAPDTETAQASLVIKARSIHYDNRTKRQKLHGFVYRIRSCAAYTGYNRHLLSGYCIYKTGLSGISSAKKTNVNPFSVRGVV